MNELKPTGVVVVLEAEHFCMSIRGVRKPGAVTVTSALRGVFKENKATRAEVMSLIQGRQGERISGNICRKRNHAPKLLIRACRQCACVRLRHSPLSVYSSRSRSPTSPTTIRHAHERHLSPLARKPAVLARCSENNQRRKGDFVIFWRRPGGRSRQRRCQLATLSRRQYRI